MTENAGDRGVQLSYRLSGCQEGLLPLTRYSALEMPQSRKRHIPLVQFDPGYYCYSNTTDFALGEQGLDQVGVWQREKKIAEVRRASETQEYRQICDILAYHRPGEICFQLLQRLGSFMGKFLEMEIKPKIAEPILSGDIDVDRLKSLLVRAQGFNYEWRKAHEVVSLATTLLTNVELLRLIETPIFRQTFDAWYTKSSRIRPCPICQREYRPIDIPYWIHYGSDGTAGRCCFHCPLSKPRKKELPTIVSHFVDACGFIPGTTAGPIERSFMMRLPEARRVEVLRRYAEMGGMDHVKKKFGTWFKCLASSNVLPEGVLRTNRGVRCIAADGHECHSLDEQYIDNWLHAQGISHEREPMYPRHKEFNASGRRRADWRVGDAFVEYFGLVGAPIYDEKLSEKIKLSRACDFTLICIYPGDLGSLDKFLPALLRASG